MIRRCVEQILNLYNFIDGLMITDAKGYIEYSGLGDTTVRSFGNRYSGIKETAIPVLETNHIVP